MSVNPLLPLTRLPAGSPATETSLLPPIYGVRWLTTHLSRGRVALAAGLLGAATLATWALWPKPVAVDVAVIAAGPMTVTVDEEGKTRIRDVFVVSAPISGKMLRSPLLAGDAVEKDRTVVAVIQPTAPPFLDFRTRLEAAAQVKAAEAAVALSEVELAQGRSELLFAEAELARAQTLSRSSTISARALEKAALDVAVRKAAVAKAEATIAMRRRELDSARARLLPPTDDPAAKLDAACCLDVRSPESGRVLRVLHTSEQAVQIGTPLVEIGDPASLEVVVELLSADAVKVSEKADARIEGWGGPERLTARVRRIESAGFTKVSALGIEEQRVRVVLDVEPGTGLQQRLGHEFRVFVRITRWETADALRVPIGALFRSGDGWAAFRIESSRAITTRLELGERNAEFAEVRAGLKPGDRVVLHPSDRVGNGIRTVVRSTEGLDGR